MERSFREAVAKLRLGAGEVFHGEGILAVTKGLLQSGVSYVGGYQGAPVSHLMDVLADANDYLAELGVHFESAANEAGAAAMLAASINYPVRGAVTWKSVVGTNVASDALSNLASAGVRGGVLIVVGEDYGEGASVIQERTHAFAMKSQMWLLDPRPNLETIVTMVEQGFELSEASSTPVMLELRIRACHLHGSFACKDNRPPTVSRRAGLERSEFDYSRICLPPSTYAQERHKLEVRRPAALKFVHERKLNELFAGTQREIGIITQGGLYNTVARALFQLGLADAFGESQIPIYVLNVTYPLVREELERYCRGKRAVLLVEEGQPAFIEEALNALLRRADIGTTVVGKDVLPAAGEYTGEVVVSGLRRFLEVVAADGIDLGRVAAAHDELMAAKRRAKELLSQPVPARPPGFCIGCPERPVFSAMKILAREVGDIHVSADIGCHTFSTLPPFNLGNSVLGYGLGLAAASGVNALMKGRVITTMGDGGLWHNGLVTGVANAVFNHEDSILLILKNGYTSATGAQRIPSSGSNAIGAASEMDVERTLRGLGVRWVRTVSTYDVGAVLHTLREALSTDHRELKVIIADGECMLERQRRERAQRAKALEAGQRVVRTRYGVDEAVCTGDHSCVRLSGCPSLTIKDASDALRVDPSAHVNEGCVGCGACGEVAHAATLCPSFYSVDVIENPTWWDLVKHRLRSGVLSALGARP